MKKESEAAKRALNIGHEHCRKTKAEIDAAGTLREAAMVGCECQGG
jgi:hypothetical protein